MPPDMYNGGLPSTSTLDVAAESSASLSASTATRHPKMHSPMSKFLEASLGNTVNNKGLRSFLENDRNVLRFMGIWDNTSAFGGASRPE